MSLLALTSDVVCTFSNATTFPKIGHAVPSQWELIFLYYSGISVPIHVLVLLLVFVDIVLNRDANNSFHLLALLNGVFDLIGLANNYNLYVFPRLNWREYTSIYESESWRYMGFFISWALGVSKLTLTFSMTANQYSAVLCAPKHNSYWTNQRTWLIIFITQFCSMIFGFFAFKTTLVICPASTGGIIVKILSVDVLIFMFTLISLLFMFYTIGLGLMYEKIIIEVFDLHKVPINRRPSVINPLELEPPNARVDKGPLVMTSIMCLVFFCSLVAMIFKILMKLDQENIGYSYVNTINCTINTHLLLLFSDVIYRRVKSPLTYLIGKRSTEATSVNPEA